MKNETLTISTLTPDEIYAIESIFYGLEGSTSRICERFSVDRDEILKKLEAVTTAWAKDCYK